MSKQRSVRLKATYQASNILGESVIWDPRVKTIWWTGIHDRAMYQLDPATGHWDTYALNTRVTAISLTPNPNLLLCASEWGIGYFDISSSNFDLVAPLYEHDSGVRLNDARVDRQGRFWVGAMVEDAESAIASADLFSLNAEMELTKHLRGLSISNGLCWSPDGQRMYFTDSPTRKIRVFDCSDGTLKNERLFFDCPASGVPDGATVDSEGFVWSAQWGSGKILRIDPAGELAMEVPVPCSQPTCVAFGGPDLDHLYVTSARDGLSKAQLLEQPQSGALFIYETPFRGLSECIFGQATHHQ